MNNFRAALLSGKGREPEQPLVTGKKRRSTAGDGLDSIAVTREVSRSADHRGDDRHRLTTETAVVLFRGTLLPVDLINLSGGGAMVRGDFAPQLWEPVQLNLGEHGTVECAVRWIRDDRFGLEFAHETQIHGDPRERDAMLLDVIRRSFPDLAPTTNASTGAVEPAAVPSDADAARRGSPRHPMIWSGTVLFQHDSYPVRLRNVSPHGAMIESPLAFPAGAELFLDLGEAGSLFATVSWAHGDQVGLEFAQTFNIADLAKARPGLTPQRWSSPQYLRQDQSDDSPWSAGWGRLTVEELKNSLEGYLKH